MYMYCKLILYKAYVFQAQLMGGGGKGLFERGGLLNLVNDGVSYSWKTTMQSIWSISTYMKLEVIQWKICVPVCE